MIRVAATSCNAMIEPMPARRGLLPLANVPDRERRDGGSKLVLERKDAVMEEAAFEKGD